MKVRLMYPDRDFDLDSELPANVITLTQDLELETLWDAMAKGDSFLYGVARQAVLLGLTDPDEIAYRQRVLADCLEHEEVARQMYALAIEAIQSERKVSWLMSSASPGRILYRSVEILKLQLVVLRLLRQLAEENAGSFQSDGFARFFTMLQQELDDDYLQTVERHLQELSFRRGVLISAELAKGNKGSGYVVRTPLRRRWREQLPLGKRSASFSFQIHPRDDRGFLALANIRNRGINPVSNSIARSAEHVKSFFDMVRSELGFYLGCLNLHERLGEKAEPTCFPIPLPLGTSVIGARGLYDVCLALHVNERVVGNDLGADDKSLVLITGANQGGKSTFLRAIGVAQLMMQSGMFVGAEAFRANVCEGIFTHFKREEDTRMKRGKLDEELSRMSDIAEAIVPNCLLLCNESFASTNEREGSEIARQVVRALLEKGVKIFFVTHMFDLASGFHAQGLPNALFLRAERKPDGTRTFRIAEGEPLPTSYGGDSYRRIFG
jgi:DNA mismatch repair ATPase MutS